ncbi:YitT family protein [Streptococcus sp. sy010]|uniref:YitT family protein n=1 Tax=Streptococcus sp. sy010 TaxID=2600148 RepID=UPI0011B4493E|nr:YitT family protein [Streptococcus sp. sy010]TWT13417.1 YitT family protein [Streptococcus sp. sy010]
MIKKTTFRKKIRFVIKRWAKRHGFLRVLNSISREKYAEKISASLFYALLSSIAVNFFFQPGNIYAGGLTGLSQILSTLSERLFGFSLSLALIYYMMNIPLFLLAWRHIGHKFTIFTIIAVSISSIFIELMPVVSITQDPIINAIFGGLFVGLGVGYNLRNQVSGGGIDIISLYVRKKTGHEVGSITLLINVIILTVAGVLFGWQHILYSMLSIFVSSRVTDAVFTKQKKMQALIITSHADKVIAMVHKKLHRGVTCINNAEGTYNREQKSVLMTVITRSEFTEFKYWIRKTDPNAFVSVSEDVRIIGRFVDDES